MKSFGIFKRILALAAFACGAQGATVGDWVPEDNPAGKTTGEWQNVPGPLAQIFADPSNSIVPLPQPDPIGSLNLHIRPAGTWNYGFYQALFSPPPEGQTSSADGVPSTYPSGEPIYDLDHMKHYGSGKTATPTELHDAYMSTEEINGLPKGRWPRLEMGISLNTIIFLETYTGVCVPIGVCGGGPIQQIIPTESLQQLDPSLVLPPGYASELYSMVAKPYSQKGYGTIIGTHLLGIAAAHPEVFQARLCYGTYSPGNTCGASLAKDCGLELVQGGDALKSKFAGVKKVFASINLDT